MRILSSARDPVHAVVEPHDRTVGDYTLQTHVVHTLHGCLGASEIPPLGIGDVTEDGGRRFVASTHVVHYSCITIVYR